MSLPYLNTTFFFLIINTNQICNTFLKDSITYNNENKPRNQTTVL